MKKIFTLICAAVLMCGIASAQTVVQRFDVTNKTEFKEAMATIATMAQGSTGYIYVKGYVDAGTLKNEQKGGTDMPNTLRNIHFIGVDDEETGARATLAMEMFMPNNNTEADGFSLHFENLIVRQSQGTWGNSKHLISFKDADKHYIDTLEFVNCELTELCRSIYRGEVNGAGEDFSGAGTMKFFRMENCTVHNGFRQANAMPAIYMAQPVNEMVFKNNTFYDLTYLNGIVSFGTMQENTGRQAVKVTFENNTLCAVSRASLLGYAGGVTSDSEFHIKNNFFLQPDWADDMNNRFGDSNSVHGGMGVLGDTEDANGILTADSIANRIAKGINITNLDGGLVQLENNVVYGYKYQNLSEAIELGNIIAIGNTEEEFFDTFPAAFTMEDVEFAWSDFAGAQQDMFQINKSHKVYTAGKNGAPIGNENNYTDQVIKIVTVTTHVEGSNSATVSVTPEKDAYTTGEKVILSVNTKGSLNTFKGWSNGMTDPTIEVELTDNLDITATFEEIPYIAVWNLDDITTNNVTKVPPVAPNYGNEALKLSYARYFKVDSISFDGYRYGAEASEAYDGSKAAIQTRNNKVSGDVRNCFIIQTPTTQFLTEGGGKADYLYIDVAEALKASKLNFFVASDNVPYNTYAISYTTDGETWTDAATFTMVGRANTNEWYPVEANLPELPAGAQIRIKGVESEGYYVSENFTNELTTEFLFVTEIILSENEEEVGDSEYDIKAWTVYENEGGNTEPTLQWPYNPSWSDVTGKLRIMRGMGNPAIETLGLTTSSKFIVYKEVGTTGQIQWNDPNWKSFAGIECNDWNGSAETIEVPITEDMLKCINGETKDGWSNTAIILQGDGLTVTKIVVVPSKNDDSAVKSIENGTVKNAVRYNLSGQKVDDSYKGVVIVNGKKMFVK